MPRLILISLFTSWCHMKFVSFCSTITFRIFLLLAYFSHISETDLVLLCHFWLLFHWLCFLVNDAGMAALNGSLASGGLSNGSGNTMEALSQAYSGIQQYAAAALPNLYNQSLLSQQNVSAAGSQKEGKFCWLGLEKTRSNKMWYSKMYRRFFFHNQRIKGYITWSEILYRHPVNAH